MSPPFFRAAGAAIRDRILASEPLFRLYLRLRYRAAATARPPASQTENTVLRHSADIERTVSALGAAGLPIHPDPVKNWDSLLAISAIARHTGPDARILDAGAMTYSMFLPSLYRLGYRDLTGINLVFPRAMRYGPIRYEPGDITATRFPDGHFDAIACLSVIEHHVDTDRYLNEMARILKPGGLLITSTDYFDPPVDTAGRTAYGAPVHIFTRPEIEAFRDAADARGLRLTGELDLTCAERVVHWRQLDLRYTFVLMTMRKGR